METKNNVLVIGLFTLLLGLSIGCFTSTTTATRKTPTIATHQMPDGTMKGGTGMQGTMDGMTMGLEGKTGDELDKAFLAEMIVHHTGAVEMAQTLLKGTKRPELIRLGNDIISAQTQEIQMMKQWQEDWFN